jgi:hypothetical protein
MLARMCRPRPGALVTPALIAMVVLAAAGPLSAHQLSPLSAESPSRTEAPTASPSPRGSTGAPEPGATSWLLLTGALAATPMAWRRRRATAAGALVVALAVFAFEDALHSVHHGFDPGGAAGCVIAAASAHVAAATPDSVTATALLAPFPEGPGLELDRGSHPVRVPCPDQQRAPPA